MVAPLSTLRRRAIRRPQYRKIDLKIDIRDDDSDISSDEDDSPSPSSTTFPPGAGPTRAPSLPLPPPPVLNPADPTDETSSTESSASSTSTEAPRGPQRTPLSTDLSSTIATTTESTSSSPTALPNTRSTTSFDSQPTTSPTRGGNEEGLGNDRSSEGGWTPTAIAFGTIAIAALILCIGVGIWWCVGYQKRRKARQLYNRSISPDGSFWDPSATFSPPTAPPPRRSPSSVMAELMGHAYAAENGGAGAYSNRNSLTPQGYLDEKRYDPSRQLPILEPAPVAQPNVRNSFASWIRRHHPLKLNPMGGRSSVYSTRTVGASTYTVNAPPVPAVPNAYRSTDRVEQSGLAVPPTDPRHSSYSRNGADDQANPSTNSILSLYENRTQQPGEAPWLLDPPPVAFGDRGVSMAPTESTWRSWGGGVSQPHFQAPPETPRRGWIEKCIKFGGLK
ncbi:hypothetical protein EsH8_II_001150 [Colletotrichum jinshuiense]